MVDDHIWIYHDYHMDNIHYSKVYDGNYMEELKTSALRIHNVLSLCFMSLLKACLWRMRYTNIALRDVLPDLSIQQLGLQYIAVLRYNIL